MIYVLRSEPLFYKRDSLTTIREHRRLLSNRLAVSINSSPSFMYGGASPYFIKGTPSPSNATSQANQGNISYKQSGLTTCDS
ncbi:hypothetical protein TB2_006008 [Malus domestica]